MKIISKWDKTLFQKGAASTTFISKWGRDSSFKVGQCLFQSGAKFYFEVGQSFQSGA